MTDFLDDVRDDEVDAFEALGRRAGAALRTPPPEDGIVRLERVAQRRNTARVAGGVVALMVLLVAGWAATRWLRGGEGAPADQRIEVRPDPPVLPFGAPGTWRTLGGSEEEPDMPMSATWTGTEVLVLGWDQQPLSRSGGTLVAPLAAAAYDVRHDRWRRLATPPSDVRAEVPPAWTGEELLVAGVHGRVYSYDPRADRWRARSGAGTVRSWTLAEPVAVTAGGVLTRSAEGWWWYDQVADRWSAVPAPLGRLDWAVTTGRAIASSDLGPLGTTSVVLAGRIAGDTTYTVFEPARKEWSAPRTVGGPPAVRGHQRCGVFDERLVCWSDDFGKLQGIVIDVDDATSVPFALSSHSNALATDGTPWFGHAWGLLLPRTVEWEALPPLAGVGGFQVAAWDGEELLMFGGTTESGEPTSVSAAYTPKGQP